MSDYKKRKIFVYTELQISVPFDKAPWKDVNTRLLTVPGLVRKTWLSGMNTDSLGGLYEFDSLEAAQTFCWEIFPKEPREFGVSFMTKIFDGDITEDASREMSSPHFD